MVRYEHVGCNIITHETLLVDGYLPKGIPNLSRLMKYRPLIEANNCWSNPNKSQQLHPPDCDCDWDEFAFVDLKFTSTMSSCFVEERVSIPGKAAAIFRNRA